VGRGEHESYCLLFAGQGASTGKGAGLGNRRLEAVSRERDGFKLAEIDLALRGEGDLFGTKQHGLPEFRIARLPEDYALLERARRVALDLLRDDPELSQPENVLLADAITRRYGALDAEPLAA
jgi:ATP-dependent DNA helicase RecG